MQRIVLLVFIVFVNSFAVCQGYRDYNWQLGVSSSPFSAPYPLSIEIEFSQDGIDVDTFYREGSMNYFNASISDNSGRLLLYSNGCSIRDSDHKMIEGTLHLNEGEFDIDWCSTNFGYPTFEGGMFLPFFEDSIVLLLHQRLIAYGQPSRPVIDSLFYTSLVKLEGKYTLLEKSVPIVGFELTDGNVESVKASSSGAWWVIQSVDNSNQYLSILIDSAKIDTIINFFIGDTLLDGSAGGQASFSPDANKYARYAPRDDLSLFDFDRSTGLLSNYQKIHVADSGFVGGLAFSPNSRFLYVSSQVDLYQFDTWAPDIEASKIHIAHYDGYSNPGPTYFRHMQLGPDCRIYMNSNVGTKDWHIIHDPDRKGKDCDFEQHGFHFPVSNSKTMPNFPNYRLDIAPTCDPGLVTNLYNFQPANGRIVLYPNPTNGPLWIKLPPESNWQDEYTINVFDNLGNICFSKEINNSFSNTTSIGLESLAPGLYNVVVSSRSQIATAKFVKVN